MAQWTIASQSSTTRLTSSADPQVGLYHLDIQAGQAAGIAGIVYQCANITLFSQSEQLNHPTTNESTGTGNQNATRPSSLVHAL